MGCSGNKTSKRGGIERKTAKKIREWGIENGYPRSLPISEGIETKGLPKPKGLTRSHPRSLPISEGIETTATVTVADGVADPRSLPISEGIETPNQSQNNTYHTNPRSLPISEGIETSHREAIEISPT